MPVYCSYKQWLSEQKSLNEYYRTLEQLCVFLDGGPRCNTFIVPSPELMKKLISLANSGDKFKRKEFFKHLSSMMLQIDIHDKKFQPGTYKNNLGQGVQISAPSAGVFEIKSGKGFSTSCKVKLNTSFEPDLQFRSDDDKHNCIAEIVSGEIATDGEMFTGNHVGHNKMEGASEFVSSDCNTKLSAWKEIINSVEIELEYKCNPSEPAVRLCGLLKYLMKHSDMVPEHKHCAELTHCALSYEPLASLYILMQPFSNNQLMPKRLNKEWCFAQYVCSDPKALMHEFKEKFPCMVDKSKRDSIIAEIKEGIGADKLYNLQEAYSKYCTELFSVVNYPCEMKLWADEVCYFISKRMCHIRATHDKDAFISMCETLCDVFPGNDYAKESRIADEKFWEGFDREKEMSEVTGFLNSFCCFQCCPCDDGLSKHCAEYLEGQSKSEYFKVLIDLNSS